MLLSLCCLPCAASYDSSFSSLYFLSAGMPFTCLVP
ncbi:hypothetical protein H206_05405 [Candidatus Electrothrix aarhusensis]|uniref:Uncharacterized protein n=1 Tax=Candidatus Electrothrix aarhusensis TaxID=1859131 RepID=A0A3S3UBH7_9BACT|nr:hypothetical protein H206_05405 [Candidatus Electrothrix aarhusensis]